MLSKVGSLSKALRDFKEMGGWVLVVERGGKDIRIVDFPPACTLVLGSEGEGVSKSVLETADLLVSIPMQGKVNSLNVSNAGAIAMWEVFKKLLDKHPVDGYNR